MKPLEGIRILSLEQFAAGPYGTKFLADMGAEVIKIENKTAGGDATRHIGPYLLGDQDSLYFQGWNTNKRSVTLDMKSPEDRRKFEALVSGADAVVNNLRGDLPKSMKLDYASLKHLKPEIVCLHISAYGRDNDRASWPGYDFLMQAEAGLMDLTGDPDGEPARFGASVIDYMTGVTGMVGLLGALRRAEKTGQGCDVDTCLFDVAVHQLGYAATWYLNEGHLSRRQARGAHLSAAPVQTFPTADGWIYIMCMTNKFWLLLLDKLSRTDLAADPRFATPAARVAHRDALTEILDSEFMRNSTDHWLSIFTNVLPIAPVYDLQQALDNPFIKKSGMVSEVPHPLKPDMKVLGSPLKFDGERPAQVAGHSLGQDNELLQAPAASVSRELV
jgi:crotonobetainyl-CoA:carnitine CoA-transferase CaiB-like acyl-CoA transferase